MTQLKQRFNILWIEDRPRVINLNKKELEWYFEQNLPDFELVLLQAITKAEVSKSLSDNSIDVVATDYNLQHDWNGLDVIKLIQRKKSLTDVLFYTAGKFDFKIDDLYKQTNHYGFIEISEGSKEVHDEVIKLIQKNLKRCQDIIFMRGILISNVINLELKINECLAHYFKIIPERTDQFHNLILENRNNSFGGKKDALARILKEHNLKDEFSGLIKSIEDIGHQRNLLAHCKVDKTNRNILISMGEEEKYDRARISKLLEKIRQVDEQADDFIEKIKILK